MLTVHISRALTVTNLAKNYTIQTLQFSQAAKHYDIVIAGGGMIGTTLACTLGKNKMLSEKKILLLEGGKESQKNISPKYSNRVSTLNPGTKQLLQDIGAWKHVEGARFCPVKKMQVWEATSDALITFDDEQGGQDDIAFVVENDVLLNAVTKVLPEAANVEVVYQSKVKGCEGPGQDGKHVQVELDDGTKYTCNLVMGCDGANSLVRKSMGIHYVSEPYGHMGLVATLKLDQAPAASVGPFYKAAASLESSLTSVYHPPPSTKNQTYGIGPPVIRGGDNETSANCNNAENVMAWQRHVPYSQFIAILPLTNDKSSLVWSTTSEKAKELAAMDEEGFVCALNDALWKDHPKHPMVEQATRMFDEALKLFKCPSTSVRQCPPKIVGVEENSRAAFPLGFGHATNYVGKGVVLVGDAAHRIHPLAGQGVNLGFGDIVCLNQVLSDAVFSGSKIESMGVLKSYETDRQRHNVPTMLAVHGLFHLYNTELAPLVMLRSLGLQSTHALTPLKRMIISQAAT